MASPKPPTKKTAASRTPAKKAAARKPVAKKTAAKKATRKTPAKKAAPRVSARDRQVVVRRAAGKHLEVIARELKYRDVAAVHQAYERALDDTLPPAPAERRRLELLKLRDREDALWPKADRGALAAIHELAQIHLERTRLNAQGPAHEQGPRKLGPIEAATVQECVALEKNAPALAAAAIRLARAVDDAPDDERGPLSATARELRMSMSNLRGLAGLQAPDGRSEEEQAQGGAKASAQAGKAAGGKGGGTVVGPDRLAALRERGDRP